MAKTIKTIEQERAAQAWEDVADVSAGQRKEYRSRVLSAAALIQTNGLAQMLAFLRTKKGADNQLADQLSSWVKDQLYPDKPTRPADDLDKILRDHNSDTLRLATREALAYLQWLRRFAQSQILIEDSSANNDALTEGAVGQ